MITLGLKYTQTHTKIQTDTYGKRNLDIYENPSFRGGGDVWEVRKLIGARGRVMG